MATVGVAARVKERMGAGRFATGPEASVKASVGRPAKRLRRSSPRLSAAQEEAPAFVPSNITVVFGLTDGYPEANLRHYAFLLEGLQLPP